MILRKCQKDAIDCFTNQRAVATETNLSLCTGAGKSLIIRNITTQTGRRILVFPWLDLLRQYWNEHKSAYASTTVLYLATEGTLPDVELLTNTYNLRNKSYVLLTTYTSAPLIFKRLGSHCAIDLLCHDEAHRIERPDYAAALTPAQKYIKHMVNLSATLPARLVPHYKYSLLRGIHDAVVRDFHMRLFMCTAKERDQTALIITMIDSLLTIHGRVKLLIYTSEANTDGADSSSVKTFMDAHADAIKDKGWWIEGIKADTRDRTTLLREFEKRRDVSILVSCKTLSEGIDLKGANCMLPWDPSNSTVENIQRIGRVLRLYRTASGGIATDQSPSTILIPIFLDEDKYLECEGDREKINLLLGREISQAEKGDFKAIVNICTALKDELADDDPELFNRLVCGKSSVEIDEDLLECIAEHRGIEKDELLDELADSLDVDEEEAADIREGMWATDEERNMLDQIAENGEMQIVVMDGNEADVFGDGEDAVVIKRRGDDCYTLNEDEDVDKEAISKIRSRRHINQRLQYDFTDDCRIVLGIEEIEGAETVGDMILMRLTSEVEADEDWEKRRLEWVAMYEKLGRGPSEDSKDIDEKRTGQWQATQRQNYRKKSPRMNLKRIAILEKTLGWEWKDNRWFEQLENWIAMYKKLGKIPSEYSKNPDEKRAGHWQSNQRNRYNKKSITAEQINILESTPGWKWAKEDKWPLHLENWIAIYKKLGKTPSSSSINPIEKQIGSWQSIQRKNYRKKSPCMSSERIKILESTPGWKWDENDTWFLQLENWIAIYKKIGKTPSSTSTHLLEKQAGTWQSNQRTHYREKKACLTKEHINILESTPGWKWEENDTWFPQLENWIAMYKKLGNIPSKRSKNLNEKRAGMWQSNQRKYYKKKVPCMTSEHIKILESTPGWTWEEDKWFTQLENWISMYKKLGRIPSKKSKYLDEKRSGMWQSNQRNDYKKKAPRMTLERIETLNNTPGWRWLEEDSWLSQQKNWTDVYEKLGKTPSQKSRDPIEKRAGSWQSTQRQNYKKKAPWMTPERIEILNNTPGWTWTADKTSDSTSVTSAATSEPEVTIVKRKRAPVTSASLEASLEAPPELESPVIIYKRKISTLETYHKRFKTMNADTYAAAITPTDFEAYHKVADLYDKRDPPAFQPTVKVAKLLTKYNKPTYAAIDLGCGQNRLRQMSYVSNINWTSIDVHAVDDTVTVANMADLPFDEDTYDIAVLCRSLWARNHMDVLAEVFRILKSGGRVVLCESFRRWLTFDTDTPVNSLLQCLLDTGFEIIYEEGTDTTDTETTDVFQYIVAQKP